MKDGVLIVGAGGVASVVAHKAFEARKVLGRITIVSRTLDKAVAIRNRIAKHFGYPSIADHIATEEIDVLKPGAFAAALALYRPRIVINAASTHTNLAIMEACIVAGASYIDTSVYELEGEENALPSWYANYEWKQKEEFRKAQVTAVLSCGFDPGVTNAFCAKALKSYVDKIDSIDILDVNAGQHGRFFATNFNPVINLREIQEDVIYWDNKSWVTAKPFSRSADFIFPKVGKHKLYSVGHDEIHSLPILLDVPRVEFWMGFTDHYISVFKTLDKVGLLSSKPTKIGNATLAPIEVLGSVLPDPRSLASDYTGEVCIGVLVSGTHNGDARQIFIYSTCDHQESFRDAGAQAISYTTGVPAVAAAICVVEGAWDVKRMVNVEELDPDPFLKTMVNLGIRWHVLDYGNLGSPLRICEAEMPT